MGDWWVGECFSFFVCARICVSKVSTRQTLNRRANDVRGASKNDGGKPYAYIHRGEGKRHMHTHPRTKREGASIRRRTREEERGNKESRDRGVYTHHSAIPSSPFSKLTANPAVCSKHVWFGFSGSCIGRACGDTNVGCLGLCARPGNISPHARSSMREKVEQNASTRHRVYNRMVAQVYG